MTVDDVRDDRDQLPEIPPGDGAARREVRLRASWPSKNSLHAEERQGISPISAKSATNRAEIAKDSNWLRANSPVRSERRIFFARTGNSQGIYAAEQGTSRRLRARPQESVFKRLRQRRETRRGAEDANRLAKPSQKGKPRSATNSLRDKGYYDILMTGTTPGLARPCATLARKRLL